MCGGPFEQRHTHGPPSTSFGTWHGHPRSHRRPAASARPHCGRACAHRRRRPRHNHCPRPVPCAALSQITAEAPRRTPSPSPCPPPCSLARSAAAFFGLHHPSPPPSLGARRPRSPTCQSPAAQPSVSSPRPSRAPPPSPPSPAHLRPPAAAPPAPRPPPPPAARPPASLPGRRRPQRPASTGSCRPQTPAEVAGRRRTGQQVHSTGQHRTGEQGKA